MVNLVCFCTCTNIKLLLLQEMMLLLLLQRVGCCSFLRKKGGVFLGLLADFFEFMALANKIKSYAKRWRLRETRPVL